MIAKRGIPLEFLNVFTDGSRLNERTGYGLVWLLGCAREAEQVRKEQAKSIY